MNPLASVSERNTQDFSPSLKFLNLSHSDILDHFPEGVFLINTRWQVAYFNHTAEEITGFKQAEVMGKFYWDVFRADLCQRDCPMRISMSTGEVLVDREVEIRTKDGQKILLLVNTAQIKKSGNVVLGGVETFHHLTCPELEAEKQECRPFADIVGISPRMQEIMHSLPVIAASESNVLIQGESGTGKELVPRALHLHSPRRQGPFVAVNCSAIPETLLESELFGHERGAFTGAVATNADLQEAMRQGRFRDDFYYRLFTVPIHLPSLREKREDISILVKDFLEQLNRKFNKKVRGVDPKVMKVLCRHAWPGNVRELQHVL